MIFFYVSCLFISQDLLNYINLIIINSGQIGYCLKSLIQKFIKFGFVGASGILVDFSITYLFKDIIGINKFVGNGFGFIVAASSNFFLNRIWTFKSKDPKIGKEMSKFIAIASAGLAINTFIVWFFCQGVFQFNFWVAKLVAISVVFIWNFSMNYFFNFKGSDKS